MIVTASPSLSTIYRQEGTWLTFRRALLQYTLQVEVPEFDDQKDQLTMRMAQLEPASGRAPSLRQYPLDSESMPEFENHKNRLEMTRPSLLIQDNSGLDSMSKFENGCYRTASLSTIYRQLEVGTWLTLRRALPQLEYTLEVPEFDQKNRLAIEMRTRRPSLLCRCLVANLKVLIQNTHESMTNFDHIKVRLAMRKPSFLPVSLEDS